MILIAEDNEVMRELLKTLLLNEGYRVIAAQDGAEAVAAFERHKKDIRLVITDIEMPNLDGVAAYREMKHINPELDVFFASGTLDKALEDRLRAEGVRYFFHKPYAPAEILEKVREIMRRPS
ncbi:MAG TPA: response regulator [Bacteroidota bacterium]|nr:response regulator [Bacteroidota bacterium]